MRRIWVGGWLLFACAGFAHAQQFPSPLPSASSATIPSPALPATDPAPATPPVLATRQTTFTIPFAVDAPRAVSEVQLHVSSDQGKTWSVANRQRPDGGHFLFRAPADGEYWFATRTIDIQGRGPADDNYTPELRVRVDTTTPKADISARVGPHGEIIANWQASDEDLVAESVAIEYQAAGDLRWQSVVLDPTKTKQNGAARSGEATWVPQSNHRAIRLRIVARDSAGNSAVVNRGIYLPSARSPGKTPDSRLPAPIDADPFRREDVKVSSKPPEAWPAENLPAAIVAKPINTGTSIAEAVGPFQAITTPVAPPVASRAEAPPADRPAVRSFDNPPTAPPPSLTPSPRAPEPAAANPNVPADAQPSFTTKKRFRLDYDSDGVPVDQIASVELWGTHDGGKSWIKWGDDPDRLSPFEVEVEQEGAFGYRIVVVHRNGMAGHTPKAGDAADIWVGVDATQPVAKFGTVAYGKGASSGQLQIQWTASDNWLSSRPITLSYSTDPQGPWTVIDGGLANTGQYFWRVDPAVPRRIYLRLEARDQAGNVGEDRLPEVVELEGLVPRGRIRGIE